MSGCAACRSVRIFPDNNTSVTNEGEFTNTITNAFPWLSTMKYFYIENTSENEITLTDITIKKNGEEHSVFAEGNDGMAYNLYDNELHAGVVGNGPVFFEEGVTTIEAGGKILAVMMAHALGDLQENGNYEFTVEMTWSTNQEQ